MDKERVKVFAERVFGDMAGAMAAGMGYLGVMTGLFRVLAEAGPLSAAQVIESSGLQARYVEEWLKGMVCAGYLDYDPATEGYTLPPEHAYLLASEGSDHYVGGLYQLAPLLLRTAPAVAEAFVRGGGVGFAENGPELVAALDAINAGQYAHRLVDQWLAALPQVRERLAAGGRILDVGCGVGRVCVALAKAFPDAEIVGIDPDPESIRRATALASAAGVGAMVDLRPHTTRELQGEAGFDLVTLCDCLHDFAAPRETLGEIRALLNPDGTLFVVEPKVASRLEENRHAVPTMFYGFSLFHCMTQSLAQDGAGLGTCLGPARVLALLREAGFSQVEELGIKSQVNLFFAARL